MVKLLSVIAGVSMISLVGSASAGDIITLGESQMEAVTAAGGVSYNSHGFDFYGNKIVLENIKKNLDVYVKIKGNYAQGYATANAFGKNTDAQSWSDAQAYEGYGSSSVSHSIAAAAPSYNMSCHVCGFNSLQ